jgi:hypothetical protein
LNKDPEGSLIVALDAQRLELGKDRCQQFALAAFLADPAGHLAGRAALAIRWHV